MACMAHGCTNPSEPAREAQTQTSPPSELPAAAEPVRKGAPFPVVRHQSYRFELAGLVLEVDPNDGGRITEFSLGGRSVVVPRSESAQAYGSSFWPSPQRDWDWPPPPELDALPWQVSLLGTALVLTSGENPRLRLSATQRIEALPELDAFEIELTLENHGSVPRQVAGWQNTRVRPGGLTFYPSSAAAHPSSAFPLEPKAGVSWFRHGGKGESRKGKLFADGEEGWLAHVDGDLLFVKVFPPVPLDRQAPGEAEVELYVDPAGVFVEVEQQGPYETIAPGASMSWRCYWLLSALAGSALDSSGEERLLSAVRTQVGRLRAATSSRPPRHR